MIIKNKSTLKEYPISKAKWNNFRESVKSLFIVVDANELKAPEEQTITNVVIEKKVDAKKPQGDKGPKKPPTGNKKDKSQKT